MEAYVPSLEGAGRCTGRSIPPPIVPTVLIKLLCSQGGLLRTEDLKLAGLVALANLYAHVPWGRRVKLPVKWCLPPHPTHTQTRTGDRSKGTVTRTALPKACDRALETGQAAVTHSVKPRRVHVNRSP